MHECHRGAADPRHLDCAEAKQPPQPGHANGGEQQGHGHRFETSAGTVRASGAGGDEQGCTAQCSISATDWTTGTYFIMINMFFLSIVIIKQCRLGLLS